MSAFFSVDKVDHRAGVLVATSRRHLHTCVAVIRSLKPIRRLIDGMK